jgi:soluble P-type ATPase
VSMLEINIPEFRHLKLSHLLLDYNGTLALDGLLIEGVKSSLVELAKHLKIHILTGDTFGKAHSELSGINCHLTILSSKDQALEKLKYIQGLGQQESIAIGNGRNDKLMLENVTLSIAVLGEEGAAKETMMSADIVVRNIHSALDLLLNPLRLIATLRN